MPSTDRHPTVPDTHVWQLPGSLSGPNPESEAPPLSAGRRLTQRQLRDIAEGRHPLTGGPFHPSAAPEFAQPRAGRPEPMPFTCGSCRFREILTYKGKTWPKCVFELYYGPNAGATSLEGLKLKRVTHGPATDSRAWWAACLEYEPRDAD